MLNLSKNELRSTAKRRTITDYKSMSKIELINAIQENNNKNIFKSKRKEIRENFMTPSKENVLKTKIKEIKELLLGTINRDEKIEEIKKLLYGLGNNLFKPEKGQCNPTIIGNAFRGDYIEYKSNGVKDEILSSKDFLSMIRKYLSHNINDHNQVFFL